MAWSTPSACRMEARTTMAYLRADEVLRTELEATTSIFVRTDHREEAKHIASPVTKGGVDLLGHQDYRLDGQTQ